MQYDGLDRLVEAQSAIFGGDGIHRFEYDAVDNLMAWTLGGVKDYARYVYGADNRLAQIQGTGGGTLHTFSHDVQGNVTGKDAADYHFDVGNRLRLVSSPTVSESYRYDGHGRRVLAWTTAGNKLSMYSATGQVIYQQLAPADQNKAIDYVYLSGSLVANREIPLGGGTAVVKYQHTDALGSPVAVTDSTGAVVERTNYDPYGGVIGGPKDGVGYTGHVMDARTGLHYMQQRYYDPQFAQFLSADAVTTDRITASSFHRFAYAENNPFSFTDPDGREAGYVYHQDGRMTNHFTDPNHVIDFEPLGHFMLALPAGRAVKVALRASGFVVGSKATKEEGPKVAGVPKEWAAEKPNSGPGTIYRNPDNPKHDTVRVVPARPESSQPGQQVDHVVRTANGRRYGESNTPVPRNSQESHVPAEKFKFVPADKLPKD